MVLLLSVLLLCACGESGQEQPPAAEVPKPPPAAAVPVAPVPSAPAETRPADVAAIPSAVAPPAQPATLLHVPLKSRLIEHPNEAVSVWRNYRGVRPTLVLISDEPLTQPIPPSLRQPMIDLLASKNEPAWTDRTARPHAAPLLGASMAVRAALEAGLVSRVVWVLPSPLDKVTAATSEQLQGFVKRLQESGSVTPEEARSFQLEGEGFAGKIGGVPFDVVSLQALPVLEEPALLHIDVGYFTPLFKGGTKTPLYPLIWEVFNRLRIVHWPVYEATVSRSNISEKMPLSGRFIGRDLVTLLEEPEWMSQSLPKSWEQRGQILYMQDLFQKEAIRDMYLQLAREEPRNASYQYGLYLIFRQFNAPRQALDYLKRAAQLDPIYAMEYQELAGIAQEQKLEKRNLQMLQEARRYFPDNPFLKVELARALLRNGKPGEALTLIRELQKLSWSKEFFPQMPKVLEQGAEFAEKARIAHAASSKL
jgi:hypothetical protein